jgi:hypothetical protein
MYLDKFSIIQHRVDLYDAPTALNSRVCAGIKGKQEQDSAIPHCVDAHAKVLAGIR